MQRRPRHLESVESEFTRQAESFAGSATLKSADITSVIGDALGDRTSRRILDVACGPGILAPSLSTKADWIFGIDFTPKQLRLARDRCNEVGIDNAFFLRGVVERLPFAAESFDASVLRLALHHFENPETVLAEVRRLMPTGGRLVVLDILTSADPRDARLHNAIERLRDPSHVSFFHSEALVDQIQSAGFEMETAETWSTPRSFGDWASIIAEPKRMDALEVVLRELAAAEVDAGIGLHARGEGLWFNYEWGLFVARAA